MPSYTLNHSLNIPGKVVSSTTVQTAAAEAKIDAEPLGGTATNAAFDIAFNHAQVKSFLLICTQDCTIKTNSSSSPGNTIQLVAGRALIWDATSPFANPFTVAVTKFYITNDSPTDTAATFSAFVLYDPTV